MSKNITTATTLKAQGAPQGIVNAAVSNITKGMGAAGFNTTKSMIKAESAVTATTEAAIKATEDQLKKQGN